MLKATLTLTTLAILATIAHSQSPLTIQSNTQGLITYKVANVTMDVDPIKGARIVSLMCNTNEILFTKQGQNNTGSTFWPAPQSFWGWPPIASIDAMPYNTKIAQDEVVMTSKIDSIYKFSVSKKFTVNSNDTAFEITYTITNHDTIERKYAPWEITRVPLQGFAFFEKEKEPVTGNLTKYTSESEGIVWYNMNNNLPAVGQFKCFSNGKGWLAYVTNSGYLLVKKYEDIATSEQAPGEAEIEIYSDAKLHYTELENLGKYVSITPGNSIVWNVKWYVRKLPDTIEIKDKNWAIVEYVKGID